ncbi:MAG: hypothetical protein BGP11_13145 [Rhodobacterales bacterium 65-51]|uniref:hypothetical protein n=1 Tax=uncultured Gemmobacter sp. TaxID=1095917 RepID=UPI00095A78EC|nr:hypothetical protein [uncultured Gemmobacter sp.]OJY26216.1 MAG: hypothetical protein BGP11_13145 [Rhodobacterales bacterium 65-51]
MAYKREWLNQEGAPYLLSLILEKLETMDEPFVTYGETAEMLERELETSKIFSLHIGGVAGKMMNNILSIAKDAPPINALVTSTSGIPGTGFAWYHDNLWRAKRGTKWEGLSKDQKLEVVKGVREAVRNYKGWDQVFHQAFGGRPGKLERKIFTERDGKPPESLFPRGEGESEQHRRLKEWARDNPGAIGLPRGFDGEVESDLLSGDRIDVLFIRGEEFAVVEVKSCLSSDDDLRRGIYQCVKYREVIRATRLPVEADVLAILLSERELPAELAARAKLLGVKSQVCKLNS